MSSPVVTYCASMEHSDSTECDLCGVCEVSECRHAPPWREPPEPASDVVEVLAEALEELLRRYVGVAESRDAGFWDPETEPVVIAARAALALEREDPLY